MALISIMIKWWVVFGPSSNYRSVYSRCILQIYSFKNIVYDKGSYIRVEYDSISELASSRRCHSRNACSSILCHCMAVWCCHKMTSNQVKLFENAKNVLKKRKVRNPILGIPINLSDLDHFFKLLFYHLKLQKL